MPDNTNPAADIARQIGQRVRPHLGAIPGQLRGEDLAFIVAAMHNEQIETVGQLRVEIDLEQMERSYGAALAEQLDARPPVPSLAVCEESILIDGTRHALLPNGLTGCGQPVEITIGATLSKRQPATCPACLGAFTTAIDLMRTNQDPTYYRWLTAIATIAALATQGATHD